MTEHAATEHQVAERKCCICGCTDLNACLERDGSPCCWITDELCSACDEVILDDVVIEVGEERRRQDLRWGGSATDDNKTIAEWEALIDRLRGEASDAVLAGDFLEYRRVLIQVAAVTVAAVQSLALRNLVAEALQQAVAAAGEA